MFQELWFSYSGAQHAMIDELAYRFDDPDMQQKELERLEVRKSIWGLKIRPLLYRLDGKAGNDDNGGGRPRYRLPPGASINDLLDDIANCIIKVLVISREYFQSEYCVQEFCLSYLLKSPQPTEAILPMHLLVGDDLKSGDYLSKTYEITISEQQQKLSGAEIIKQVYKKLCEQFQGDDRYQFDGSVEAFLEKIKNTQNLITSRLKTIDQAPVVAKEVCCYAYSALNKLPHHSNHIGFVDELYEKWKKHQFAIKLLKEISDEFQKDYLPDNKEAMEAFLDEVITVLSDKRVTTEDEKDKNCINELFGLVFFHQIKPYSSQLLAYCHKANSIPQIEIGQAGDNRIMVLWQNALTAAMAFAVANRAKPLIPDLDYKVKGIQFPDKIGIGYDDQQVADVVINLAADLIRMDPYKSITTIDQIRNDPYFLNAIRKELENIRKEKYGMDGRYGVLVVYRERHRNDKGRYELIDKVKELLELDKHGLKLPYIIFKQASRQEPNELNMLFSWELFSEFDSQFQRLKSILE